MSDAFTKDDGFDLDSWISGARLPEKAVTVYGRADLVAEFAELEQRLLAMQSGEGVQDDRLTGDPRIPLARQMDDLREQMKSSALTFRFRALLKDEVVKIREAAPKKQDGDPDDDYVAHHWISAASVSPKVTPEQAAQIRERIGEGQFAALWEAAYSTANDRRVSVPFSLAASAALTKDS